MVTNQPQLLEFLSYFTDRSFMVQTETELGTQAMGLAIVYDDLHRIKEADGSSETAGGKPLRRTGHLPLYFDRQKP